MFSSSLGLEYEIHHKNEGKLIVISIFELSNYHIPSYTITSCTIHHTANDAPRKDLNRQQRRDR